MGDFKEGVVDLYGKAKEETKEDFKKVKNLLTGSDDDHENTDAILQSHNITCISTYC